MTEAEFIVDVQGPRDGRDTASNQTSATIACRNAARVARDIDRYGEMSDYAKHFPARTPGHHIGVGFGVLVRYPNGNLRTFHGFEYPEWLALRGKATGG